MDQVQVHGREPEPLPARLERLQGGVEPMVVVPQLRRNEDLLPRESALPHRGADVRLVPVELRGVDEPVAGLERDRHRLVGGAPRRDLPHPEAEQGHLHTVVQLHRRPDREGHGVPSKVASDLNLWRGATFIPASGMPAGAWTRSSSTTRPSSTARDPRQGLTVPCSSRRGSSGPWDPAVPSVSPAARRSWTPGAAS